MVGYGGERGLLGLAFHPSYKTNGMFYIYWTLKSGDIAVNAYKVSSTSRRGHPDQLEAAPDHPPSQRPTTTAACSPSTADGYLFIGVGDGGGGGDPSNNAQNVNVAARQDPADQRQRHDRRHPVPDPGDNPYVGRTGRDEIWSIGLRNPWRFSFDRATNDLWIGDVGQDKVRGDRPLASAGVGYGRRLNFGWHVMEGRHCYSPATGCSTSGKTLPLIEYSHCRGLRGDGRVRVPRLSCPDALCPLCVRRLLLGHDLARATRARARRPPSPCSWTRR